MRDIETESDIDVLVRTFYGKLLENSFMSQHFQGLNFEEHFPKIVSFWSLILLDKFGYASNVFDKHVHLKINQEHFDTWVKLFSETIDELYKGEKAELAKQRAAVLGYTFSSKFTHLNNN